MVLFLVSPFATTSLLQERQMLVAKEQLHNLMTNKQQSFFHLPASESTKVILLLSVELTLGEADGLGSIRDGGAFLGIIGVLPQ